MTWDRAIDQVASTDHTPLSGGILALEMGMGKTLVYLTLALTYPGVPRDDPGDDIPLPFSPATLIVLPGPLMRQAVEDMVTHLKVTVVDVATRKRWDGCPKTDGRTVRVAYFLTRRQLSKYTEAHLQEADLVVVSPRVAQWLMPMRFHRVIVDESHDVMPLPHLHYDFVWWVSGTPFAGCASASQYLSWLSHHEFEGRALYLTGENVQTMKALRHHTLVLYKADVQEWAAPPITEHTCLLTFSPAEAQMYQALAASQNAHQMRCMCCDPRMQFGLSYEPGMTMAEVQQHMLLMNIRDSWKKGRHVYMLSRQVIRTAASICDMMELLTNDPDPDWNGLWASLRPHQHPLFQAASLPRPFDSEEEEDVPPRFLEYLATHPSLTDEQDRWVLWPPLDHLVQLARDMKMAFDMTDHPWPARVRTRIVQAMEEVCATLEAAHQRLVEQRRHWEGAVRVRQFLNTVLQRLPAIVQEDCLICFEALQTRSVALFPCGHHTCAVCMENALASKPQCPQCRREVARADVHVFDTAPPAPPDPLVARVGTKLAAVIRYIGAIQSGLDTAAALACTDPPAGSTGEKFIVFSQYDGLLTTLATLLTAAGIPAVIVKGNGAVRQRILQRFQQSQAHPVILLSTAHSASGANLTSARNIVFLDPAPRHMEQQAIARAHRLGQTQEVRVVRFRIRGTIEE